MFFQYQLFLSWKPADNAKLVNRGYNSYGNIYLGGLLQPKARSKHKYTAFDLMANVRSANKIKMNLPHVYII